jgi:hypothetical protein
MKFQCCDLFSMYLYFYEIARLFLHVWFYGLAFIAANLCLFVFVLIFMMSNLINLI